MKRSVAKIASMAVLLAPVVSASPMFGSSANHNLVAFQDMSCAASDVRGRLAVQGNLFLTDYNVACQANLVTNPSLSDQCPPYGSWSCSGLLSTFGYGSGYYGIVGGTCRTNDGSCSVSDYSAYTRVQISGAGAYGQTGYQTRSNTQFIGDCSTDDWAYQTTPYDFTSSKPYLTNLSSTLSQRAATGTVNNNGYGTLTLIPSGAAVEVFNISGAALSTANTLNLQGSLANGAYAIINVNGATVSLQGGTSGLKVFSEYILWNFYEATSIQQSNYAIFGSVLAPNANMKNPQGVIWGQVFVNSFVSASNDLRNPSGCAQVNWIPFRGELPPTEICGDGIVQSGEQCDNGNLNGQPSSCCRTDCTFAPSTTVCRQSAGDCDVAESCSGSSASCPADAFLPEATPCSSAFGICDLRLSYHCPGTGAHCVENAPAPLFDWDSFNLISFNTFNVNGGDVEGSFAVRNNGVLKGFDAGLKLTPDTMGPFTVVSGGDLTWTDGEVHPSAGTAYPTGTRSDGSTIYGSGGYIGVAGTFTAPDYLQASLLANAYITPSQFDSAQAYYQRIQDLLAALGTNAEASVIYGDGLQLTCSDDTYEMYHVKVSGDVISNINWYTTSGCKATAGWVIDITGSGPVTIKGGPFSGVVEKIVYNVLGADRVITGGTGITGNILAPRNSYTQSTGVTYGRVIVGDVPEARQNNMPNCINFKNFVITNYNLRPVSVGDSWIYVVSVGDYHVGDMVCSPSQECHKVTGVIVNTALKRQTQEVALQLDSAWKSSYDTGAQFSTEVNPNVARTQPVPVTQNPEFFNWSSDASTVTMSAFAIALLALL